MRTFHPFDPPAASAMPKPGTFFLVVGPSGAGKDTLLHGARHRLGHDWSTHVFARRIINRPLALSGPGMGEGHLPVSDDDFDALARQGQLLIDWSAHGHRYGLSTSLRAALRAGRHVVANGSRTIVPQLAERVPHLTVVQIDAPTALLAQRLAERRRETPEAVAQRLARRVHTEVPAGVHTVRVVNDGSVQVGVDALLAVLCPLRSAALAVEPAQQATVALTPA